MYAWVDADGNTWRFSRLTGVWEKQVGDQWVVAPLPSAGLQRTDVSSSVTIVETMGPQGLPGDPGTDGRGFTWRGSYDSLDLYLPDDVITFGGSMYVCIAETIQNPDTEPTSWELAVEKGDKATTDWLELTGVPAFIAAGDTAADARAIIGAQSVTWRPAAADITDATDTGQALLTATDVADAWTTLGVVPSDNLPSYVDDVLEFANVAAFPGTGESNKIYVDTSTNDTYRWTGSQYVRISDRILATGITDSTAVGRSLLTAATEAAARAAIHAENSSTKGQPGGYAPLDNSGIVDPSYLPSMADDVLEYANLAGFPGVGEISKLYIARDTGDLYRWSSGGSAYVRVSDRITATGITDSTAVGRSVLTAATQAAGRAALDADQVLEFTDVVSFPLTGATGKLYVDLSTADLYRWTGSAYARVSQRVTATGITDSTATGRSVVTAADPAAARTAIGAENAAMKGQANGYAPLNSATKIDAAYLPAYVNDVFEYADFASLPATGESNKIYVTLDTGFTYRWSGSTYVRISDSVAAAGISDSTVVGRALITAANAAAARSALALSAIGETVSTAATADIARAAMQAAQVESLHTSFRHKADGAVPVVGDDGVPVTITNIVPVVKDGLMQSPNLLGGAETRATYWTQPITGGKHIGATFKLSPGTGTIAAGLIFWEYPIPTPYQVPNSPFHLAIWATGWELGVWHGGTPSTTGTFTSVGSGTFGTPLAADWDPEIAGSGTLHRAEAWLDGANAIIDLPDGTTVTITDSRILSIPANVACHEHYRSSGTAGFLGFEEIWASDELDIVRKNARQTLTAKTLVSPRIGPAILDVNGNTALTIDATASAVNHIRFVNTPTGVNPVILPHGADSTMNLELRPKGNSAAVSVQDANAKNIVGFARGAVNPVNYWNLYSSGSGEDLSVYANGTDTNIGFNLVPKGSGALKSGGVPVVRRNTVLSVTSEVTAGSAGDYLILVGAGGVLTLPTAVGNTGLYSVKNVTVTNRTVGTTSGQTIDGAASLTLVPGQSVSVTSDGSNWVITDRSYVVPDPTATLVDLTSSQTLGNKTLNSPRIGTGLLDTNGSTALAFDATASAVNYIRVYNGAAGVSPLLYPGGTDTDISLLLRPKGNNGAVTAQDVNGRNILSFNRGSATAVNYWNVYNSGAGTDLSMYANGSDTNIGINIVPKGTGTLKANGVPLVTTTGTQTLTGKSISGATNTLSAIPQSAVTGLTTDLSGINTALSGKESTANKGQANGYVPLNASTKIDSAYLPSYVDDVLEYATEGDFPGTGETGKIYIAQDTNSTHRWTGSVYVQVGGDPGLNPGNYATTIGNGVATSFVITHNLNTVDVLIGVWEAATGTEVNCDKVRTTANTVTLTFGTAPTTNAYRVVVINGGVTADAQAQAPTWTITSLTTSGTLSAVAAHKYIVLVGDGGAPTLPTAVGNTSLYTIKNVHSASRTITTTSAQTIEGVPNLILSAGASVELVSDGANWRIV